MLNLEVGAMNIKPEHMSRREDRWNAGYRDAIDGLPKQANVDGYNSGYDAGWIVASNKRIEDRKAAK
jgi:hypothetical protein